MLRLSSVYVRCLVRSSLPSSRVVLQRSIAAARPDLPKRNYASFSKPDDETLTQDQAERINQIASTLRSNPEIKNLLQEFQVLLENKGFKPDQPPSMFEMIKILAEKDVREHLRKLKDALEAANVSFSPEDIQAFMNFYNVQKK